MVKNMTVLFGNNANREPATAGSWFLVWRESGTGNRLPVLDSAYLSSGWNCWNEKFITCYILIQSKSETANWLLVPGSWFDEIREQATGSWFPLLFLQNWNRMNKLFRKWYIFILVKLRIGKSFPVPGLMRIGKRILILGFRFRDSFCQNEIDRTKIFLKCYSCM